MSWDEQVNALLNTGKIKRAAIIGRSGGVWAASKGYDLKEHREIAEHIGQKDYDFSSHGIVLAGMKYFFLRSDPNDPVRPIMGRKGNTGCILVSTKQSIIVVEYEAPVDWVEAQPIVIGLANHLLSPVDSAVFEMLCGVFVSKCDPCMVSHLQRTLQTEFSPFLDSSLVALLTAELEADDTGGPVVPTQDQIESLRRTLNELATQAEAAELVDLNVITTHRCASSTTTTTTTNTDVTKSSVSVSSASNSCPSSSCGSNDPLEFLCSALPHISVSNLISALECHKCATNGKEDIDMEAVIEQIINEEYAREMQDDEPEVANVGKTAKRSKKRPRSTTIYSNGLPPTSLRSHPPKPASSSTAPVPNSWARLASLAEHLSTLLPPHPPEFFLSRFHASKPSESTYDALVACLNALVPRSAVPSIDADTLESLVSITNAPTALCRLALSATQNEAERALEIVLLLQELKRDSDGIDRDRGPSAVVDMSARIGLAFTSPPLSPPSSPSLNGGTRNRPPSERRSAAREYMQRRDELLREAARAWRENRGGGKGGRKFGGEIAATLAERAREYADMAKAEELESARRRVDFKRRTSDLSLIDLHGTTASQAVTIVLDILASEGATTARPIHIVTGRGIHSAKGVSVIRPAMIRALREEGWKIDIGDGYIDVKGRL